MEEGRRGAGVKAYECLRSGLGKAAASSRWTAMEKRFQKRGS